MPPARHHTLPAPDASLIQGDQTLPHGVRLRCQWAGEAGCPRLMLLHGFPQAAFIWEATQRALADQA